MIWSYLAQEQDKKRTKNDRRPQCKYDEASKKYIYELVFFPSNGFCLDNKPLPLNTSLKFKFNRLDSGFSSVYIGKDPQNGVHKGRPLQIKDCYAICEYVSSPSIRNYFTRIKSKPISYKYDEVTVSTRDISKDVKNITLHNIKGGKTPKFFFFALTRTSDYQGSSTGETTSFGFHKNLTNIDLTLNGQSLSGFPMVRNLSLSAEIVFLENHK